MKLEPIGGRAFAGLLYPTLQERDPGALELLWSDDGDQVDGDLLCCRIEGHDTQISGH